MSDKIIKAHDKVMDWWAKHNITTRAVVMTLLVLFAAVIGASIYGKDVKHFNKIIDVLSFDLLWLTVVILAGINGATAILDKLIELKKGK